MTKLEICRVEDANPGRVYLYPEGAFFKAYQKSAWLLCTRVHPFKVSARPLKGLEGPLLSVGFPQSSLDKFSAGYQVAENTSGGGYKQLIFNELIDFAPYEEWRSGFVAQPRASGRDTSFNSLPVYGAAYRLAVEATEMTSRLGRNYRYSLGEDIRLGTKRALLSVTLAGKGEERGENVRKAKLAMMDVELSLRLLSDLKVLPDKRYVYFLEMAEDITRQLSNWERSLSKTKEGAGVPSPP